MCIGVTPSGQAASTRPSKRSATAWAMTLAAKLSVPVGRCGPCCSTLPAGRITNGFFLNCAAMSGCVRSEKYRLGNMARSRVEACLRAGDHLGELDVAPALLARTQRPIDHGDRDIAVRGIELVAFAAAAAFGEHFELGQE